MAVALAISGCFATCNATHDTGWSKLDSCRYFDADMHHSFPSSTAFFNFLHVVSVITFFTLTAGTIEKLAGNVVLSEVGLSLNNIARDNPGFSVYNIIESNQFIMSLRATSL